MLVGKSMFPFAGENVCYDLRDILCESAYSPGCPMTTYTKSNGRKFVISSDGDRENLFVLCLGGV